jgi:hypothetical protein
MKGQLVDRRKFLLNAPIMGLSTVGIAASLHGSARAAILSNTLPGIYLVNDYGAVGDGITDNTAAFTAAISAAQNAGGGTVAVGPGRYNFIGTITLPPHVSLIGTIPGPAEDVTGNNAATLYISTPSSNRNPFILTKGKTVVQDLAFYYPQQVTSGTPIDYPPVIQTSYSDNVIRNLYLQNVYRGIYLNTGIYSPAVSAGRDLIENVRIGVFGEAGIVVDHTLDVSRLNNIHIWPFYGANSDLRNYASNHTFGIIIKRADSIQLNNVFLFGLFGGLYLIASSDNPTTAGASNGQACNLSTDTCVQGGVIAVATSNPQGWTFNNLAVACPTGTVAGINISPGGVVNPSTAPHLNIVGCAMWGATPSAGWVARGSTSSVYHLTAVTQNENYIASGP